MIAAGLRALILKIGRTWTNFQQLGGDASENGDFHRWKQRFQGTFFSGDKIATHLRIRVYSERNEQLGAMRQKMAIFKGGNSVCGVHIFFQDPRSRRICGFAF